MFLCLHDGQQWFVCRVWIVIVLLDPHRSKWRAALAYNTTPLGQGTVLSSGRHSERRRLWTSMPWRVACELFSLVGFYAVPGPYIHPAPLRLRVVKGICVFSCNLPLRLWRNGRPSLVRATAVTRGLVVVEMTTASYNCGAVCCVKFVAFIFPACQITFSNGRVRAVARSDP